MTIEQTHTDDRVTGDGAAFVAPPPGPRTRRQRKHLYLLWFALPSIVMVLLFFALPFVANGVFAFTQWTGYSTRITWNGLENFRVLAASGVLLHAITVTAIFALLTMTVQNVVGLVLAKALQRTGRVTTVFRAIYFIPVLISPLAAGYIWAGLLRPDGSVNAFIELFVPGFDFAWLGHDVSALIVVALIDAWKWSGLVTLIYISGLNRIPRSVNEAALLDGAGAWRRFRSIELPLLAPSFTFNLVITLVGSFSALDVVFSTTGGGPGRATEVLNAAVYQQYAQGLFGTASALGLVITVMVVVTAVPLIAFLRSREVKM